MVDYIKYKPYTSNNWFVAMKEIAKHRPWITKELQILCISSRN